MPHIYGDQHIHGISNVDLRVSSRVEHIELNANTTSPLQLIARCPKIYSIAALNTTPAENAVVKLPNEADLPTDYDWSWTGLFFESEIPVQIQNYAGDVLFTALPNDIYEVMWVRIGNLGGTYKWQTLSQLPDEKVERISGLLYTLGTDTVELTDNNTKLTISPRVLFFNYGQVAGVAKIDYKRLYFEGGDFTVPATSSGNTEQTYITINDSGSVVFDNVPVTMATRNRVLVGRGIRYNDSGTWKLINFKYMPNLADSDPILRTATLKINRFYAYPNTSYTESSVLQACLNFSDFFLTEEGINYENSKLEPNRLSVAAQTPGEFYSFYPGSLNLTKTHQLAGNVYYNTATQQLDIVPSTKYTIQVLLATPRGELIRLYGQILYDLESTAAQAALGSTWDVTGLPADFVAATAYIVRGDQYTGSTTLDLTKLDRFCLCTIPQQFLSENSASGGTVPSVTGVSIYQDGTLVGLESSVKNFDFAEHLPVTVAGDTVNIQVSGTLNNNAANINLPVKYDWIGTKQEWEAGRNNNTIPDNWVCFITDDYDVQEIVGVNLLDFKWADHLLNDSSWLRADTFTWQAGSVYATAYQHLVDDYTGITSSQETISGTTITYYLAADGHKIVLADQESNVESIYTATGIAWYYILDTTNQRFKLPRTKFGFTGFRTAVGNYVEPGLPNITGTFSAPTSRSISPTESGAFSGSAYGNEGDGDAGSQGRQVSFDASRSSSIYGNSTTNQPAATQMYLYFYIGGFTTNALEQTAGISAELFNSKADITTLEANGLYITTYIDTNSWRREYYSDNTKTQLVWLEQGGIVQLSGGVAQITFDIPYSSTNYFVQVSQDSKTATSAVAYCDIIAADMCTTTGFRILGSDNADGASNSQVCWEVKGV